MFEEFFELNQDDFLQNLAQLLAIQSVSEETDNAQFPFGKDVDDAFELVVNIAREHGFHAENLKHVAEISFGDGDKKVYIACHADVVPCSAGWIKPPYKMTIENGRIYGRGVLDNKGAVMAVLYAFIYLKEHGIAPKAALKLLVGGSEETTMSDMITYVKTHGLPDEALTPDSVFPIVNTEAGMLSAKVMFQPDAAEGSIQLKEFDSGTACNAVPDYAKAVIHVDCVEAVYAWFRHQSYFPDKIKQDGCCFIIFAEGKPAHASEPDKGVNALTGLAKVLYHLFHSFQSNNRLLQMLTEYFADDFYAEKLGVFCEGAILGKITQNVGICHYNEGYFTIDMRIPVSGQLDKIRGKLSTIAEKYGFTLCVEKMHEYTHVPPNCDFLKKLAFAFEQETGQKAQYLGSSGLTYAKAFDGRCVAFGPVYDETGDECGGIHADDEYVRLDVLKRLSAIYAGVINRLWC